MYALLVERIKLVNRLVTEAAEDARGLLFLGGERSVDQGEGEEGQGEPAVFEPAVKLDGSSVMVRSGKSG
ncbi:hypothetical protein G6F42_019468 [Rhizopus arrhizus]|nr:hypothetical protein G6F42_019468 [Rhizopus arrhizus]